MRLRTAIAASIAAASIAFGGFLTAPSASATALLTHPAATPSIELYVPPPISCAPASPLLCVPGPRPSHRVRPSATPSRWAPPAPAAGSGSDSRALPGTGYRLLAEVGMGLLLLVAGGALVLLGRESRLRRQEGER